MNNVKYVNLKDLQTPKDGFVVYLNRFWFYDAVNDGVVFYSPPGVKYYVPQCNRNKSFLENHANLWPGTVPVHIDVAYVNERDWHHD